QVPGASSGALGAVPSASTTPAVAAAPTPAAAAAGGAAATLPAGELITLTTDLVKATIDSRGGELVRLELLKEHDQFDRSHNVVLFDRTRDRIYLARSGLATVDGVAYPNHDTLFRALPGPRVLAARSDSLELTLESPVVDGVQLRKIYTFKRDDYRIDVKFVVINTTAKALAPQLYLQLVRDGNPPPGTSSFYFTFTGPAMYTDAKKFQKIDFKDIDKGKTDHDRSANDGWIAMVQHYFASAWLIPPGPREFVTSKLADNLYAIAMIVKLGTLAPDATLKYDATLFAGPQEEKKLEAMAPGLELVKDYGYFTILAKPLFWLLDQLHKVFGNWGWSIVALVVLLKIAFYWLNAKAYASMAKMKAINPKVMEMRERLKDKPQQMQQEMMRIYREEKVNPLGGCLPIVVQIPFFIALYWVLLSSVEMRNAPWLYISDLAQPDALFGKVPFLPLYLGPLPLLMLASTLVQTWLNPTPPDPVQAKMMWIMPVVFSFMFFAFPAGLVLYWLTNNLLSIAQQWFINKRLGVAPKLKK
ncbi:MAG TPA: membrane protein insertase YidC, partial [Burkholderiaceae bacterium]|nr:membrane protein insertase YidC [Burkholderiaceae bacterium]